MNQDIRWADRTDHIAVVNCLGLESWVRGLGENL